MKLNLFFGIVTLAIIMQAESFAQDNTSFLDPPQIITNPVKTLGHSAEHRKFTGIPSLAISRKGINFPRYLCLIPVFKPPGQRLFPSQGKNAYGIESDVKNADGKNPNREDPDRKYSQ